jgi:hypothetical protein
MELKDEKDVTNIFDTLTKITKERYNSIFYFDENNYVKYLSRKEHKLGFPNILIYKNKGYNWRGYCIHNHVITILYYEEFGIPNEIIDQIKTLPESQIEYVIPNYFKLYYLLKQGYKINFVKSKYFLPFQEEIDI